MLLFDYHTIIPEISKRESIKVNNENLSGNIGLEIEKASMPEWIDEETKYQLFDEGCVLQRDSSVPDGFELATRAYSLFGNEVEDAVNGYLKPFLEVKKWKNCGGHISISLYSNGFPMASKKIFDRIKGYLILLYCLEKNRIDNKFCKAYSPINLVRKSNKNQAIRFKRFGLEFRIFGPFLSVKETLFRIELIRHFVTYPNKTILEVLDEIQDNESILYQTLKFGRSYGQIEALLNDYEQLMNKYK